MPVTRLASRRAASRVVVPSPVATKRRAVSRTAVSSPIPAKRRAIATNTKVNKRQRAQAESPSAATNVAIQDAMVIMDPAVTAPVPAQLSFSFEAAKQHLIDVDARFEDLFDKLACKPFEHLETVHPFRALTTSILAQQISWLAARSVIHKFKRLYDPSLPETWRDSPQSDFFPTPEQVARTDVETLRTAGLSERKAEYVIGLSERFADGRLSTQKLVEANDEELTELLTAVRGIGKWTADMFAIFSLRRPDILPVGDLGVQRGVARWILALHSPSDAYVITPDKTGNGKGKDAESDGEKDDDTLPTFSKKSVATASRSAAEGLASPNAHSVAPASNEMDEEGLPVMPPLLTPSINRTLAGAKRKIGKAAAVAAVLPEGLTPAQLKSRLDGKKIKGTFLTPKEMEDLTESWRPYRSLGVYYMWSLAAPSKGSK